MTYPIWRNFEIEGENGVMSDNARVKSVNNVYRSNNSFLKPSYDVR